MGLFKRDPGAPTAPASAASSPPSFGHAAFDPADIDDARRGHPAVSLQAFATANGLDYRNAEIYHGFLSTLPLWPEYTFNMCRGVFPGGRLGQVGHELLELAASEGSIRAGGTFYDVRVTTRRSMREMMNLGSGDPENVPFAGNAVWIPTTTVHVRTPELNQFPVLTIREAGMMSRSRLDSHGLPGFRLDRGPNDADQFLTAVATACRPALTTRRDAYIRLRVEYGTVALSVNGYRTDERDLRHLIEVASHAAQSMVALTRPAVGAFTTAGPRSGSIATPAGVPIPHPSYLPAYAQVAGELGLVHEDPWSLAHLLPRCPIPGTASGVLFGTLPGTSAVGRMVWFEHGGKYSGSVRGGVIVPATDGATTPLGGTRFEPTAMRVEVVDGLAYCWKVQRFTGRLESRQLVPDARAALAAVGAAVV